MSALRVAVQSGDVAKRLMSGAPSPRVHGRGPRRRVILGPERSGKSGPVRDLRSGRETYVKAWDRAALRPVTLKTLSEDTAATGSRPFPGGVSASGRARGP